jgi:hypothetical protein
MDDGRELSSESGKASLTVKLPEREGFFGRSQARASAMLEGKLIPRQVCILTKGCFDFSQNILCSMLFPCGDCNTNISFKNIASFAFPQRVQVLLDLVQVGYRLLVWHSRKISSPRPAIISPVSVLRRIASPGFIPFLTRFDYFFVSTAIRLLRMTEEKLHSCSPTITFDFGKGIKQYCERIRRKRLVRTERIEGYFLSPSARR